MNIDDLTIGEAKELASMFGGQSQNTINGLEGKFVIVRCHDAGVHAGILKWAREREAFLEKSRRLWYWKPANKASFLSGVAVEGLHQDSKLGAPIDVHLTETCEIIACSNVSVKSISKAPSHEQ